MSLNFYGLCQPKIEHSIKCYIPKCSTKLAILIDINQSILRSWNIHTIFCKQKISEQNYEILRLKISTSIFRKKNTQNSPTKTPKNNSLLTSIIYQRKPHTNQLATPSSPNNKSTKQQTPLQNNKLTFPFESAKGSFSVAVRIAFLPRRPATLLRCRSVRRCSLRSGFGGNCPESRCSLSNSWIATSLRGRFLGAGPGWKWKDQVGVGFDFG